MSVSHVSHAPQQYQVPAPPKAKHNDERSESAANKRKEAATGKEAAVPVKTNSVNIKA